VDTLLVDQLYAAYGNLSKQAALRVVFTDTERELKMITADREEMLQSRYDDYASSRAVLQRRQEAVDAKLKKCRSDMDANKTALGKRAQEFVGTLLAQIAKGATTSPANGPNTAGKSDLEALEKRLEGKLAAYQKTLAAQENVIASQASRFSTLESDAQRNHAKLEAVIAKQANQISTLETHSQRREEVIKQQELSLSTLKSDASQLRTEIGLLKNRVQTLESSGPQVRAHLQGLEHKATIQQTATTNMRNNHTTLQRAVEKMQTAHDAKTTETAGMQKTLASFEGLQLRLESLESIVKAITATMSANSAKAQPAAAAAATANATTTTATTKADREEVSKLAADVKQLQMSQAQKADRQEVESSLTNMRGILANSVGGLADQFGELLDTHAKRLVVIEAAANVGSSTTEKQAEDEAAKDALAKQTTSTAATTTAPAEAPGAEAKLKEAEMTRLKTELDELKEQLNSTLVDVKRCQEAFASLHNRHEEGQGAIAQFAQFRQETTELLGVLQHAVMNLSSQFNNITTEELCKRILRHVGVLSGQKTADELTKRVDSLERAMHGGVNGADMGSSKKRKTSMQVPGAGTSGARR
jgi:chromosome segregation ATPase